MRHSCGPYVLLRPCVLWDYRFWLRPWWMWRCSQRHILGLISISFSWNPGITWPVTGKSAGRLGMASSQVLDDLWASTEAVLTWIYGVSSLNFTLGACLVRYKPDEPELNITEIFFRVRHIFHWFFPLLPHGGVNTACNSFDVACLCGGGSTTMFRK